MRRCASLLALGAFVLQGCGAQPKTSDTASSELAAQSVSNASKAVIEAVRGQEAVRVHSAEIDREKQQRTNLPPANEKE
jgi:hypothetical protein